MDLIKVSIDPATNVATLTNALTQQEIGRDDLNSRSDNAPVTLSDADKAAMSAALTDLQKLRAKLNTFTALFASGTPSIQQLTDSGVFDTTSAFNMDGENFQQFASHMSQAGFLVGIKLASSDLVLSTADSNAAIARVTFTASNGQTEKIELSLSRASADSDWKVIGNGRIAEIGVEAMATYNQPGGTFTSGLDVHIDPSAYNVNVPSAIITGAKLVGPNLVPSSGIEFESVMNSSSLSIKGTQGAGNMIPECTSTIVTNCVTIAGMTHNATYKIQLLAGQTPLNGNGYEFVLGKKPVRTNDLTPAMFPVISALTINGVPLTQVAQVQASKTVFASWTVPAEFTSDNANFTVMQGQDRFEVQRNLKRSDTSQLFAIDPALVSASYAYFWLSNSDVYGRRYGVSRDIR